MKITNTKKKVRWSTLSEYYIDLICFSKENLNVSNSYLTHSKGYRLPPRSSCTQFFPTSFIVPFLYFVLNFSHTFIMKFRSTTHLKKSRGNNRKNNKIIIIMITIVIKNKKKPTKSSLFRLYTILKMPYFQCHLRRFWSKYQSVPSQTPKSNSQRKKNEEFPLYEDQLLDLLFESFFFFFFGSKRWKDIITFFTALQSDVKKLLNLYFFAIFVSSLLVRVEFLLTT